MLCATLADLAQPEECYMAGSHKVTAVCFQLLIQFLQQGVFYLYAPTAGTTNDVMVVMPGYFIHQVPAGTLRRVDHPVLYQEVQGTVNGCLGQPGDVEGSCENRACAVPGCGAWYKSY